MKQTKTFNYRNKFFQKLNQNKLFIYKKKFNKIVIFKKNLINKLKK